MDDEEEDKELLKIRIETLKTMIGKLKSTTTAVTIQPIINTQTSISNSSRVNTTWSRTSNGGAKLNNRYKFEKTHTHSGSGTMVHSLVGNNDSTKTHSRDPPLLKSSSNSRYRWEKNLLENKLTVQKTSIQQPVSNSSMVNQYKLVKDNFNTHDVDHRKLPTRTTQTTRNPFKDNSVDSTGYKNIVSLSSKYKFIKETASQQEPTVLKYSKPASRSSLKWNKNQRNTTNVSLIHSKLNKNDKYTFIQRRYHVVRKATPLQMKYRQIAYILSQYKLLKKRRFRESFAARRLRFVKSKSFETKDSRAYSSTNSNVNKQSQNGILSPNKALILSRHGTHYKVAGNLKSLRRLSAEKLVPPKSKSKHQQSLLHTPRRTISKYKSIRTPNVANSAGRKVASRVLKRSLTLAQRKKVNKQKFCLFFNRFGKCKRGDNCKYIHDVEKVAVCTRFLRGTCKDEKCLFSHQINPNKMPVCSFFLLGKCNNEKCPYRHVNVSDKAEVCQDFLKGYCSKEDKCTKKHVLDCIDYAATGKCSLGNKCPMVHRGYKKAKRRRLSSLSGVRKPKGFYENSLAEDKQQSIDVVTVIEHDGEPGPSKTNLDSPLRNKGKLHLLPKFISEKISLGNSNKASSSATIRNLFNFERRPVVSTSGESSFSQEHHPMKNCNESYIPLEHSPSNEEVSSTNKSEDVRIQARSSFKQQDDFISLE